MLTILLVVSWIKHWQYPERLKPVVEFVHIVGAVIVTTYVLLRLTFRAARMLLIRRDPVHGTKEREVNWDEPCSPHVSVIASKGKAPEKYARDLQTAVALCHEALGFEHETFSTSARYKLYDGWCKANAKSMLLINPKFGGAKGKPIGVTIILPLTPEGLRYMQAKNGGVLKLDSRHILPASRRAVPILLIDTLLLKDEWIPAYGPLALRSIFHHLSMFYNENTWARTDLYCCIYQDGTIGSHLPGMRRLITSRGFRQFGTTAEGETMFRLCLRSFAADPLTKNRYQIYKSTLEECAGITRDSVGSSNT